jgi:hypothetical protein
MRSMKPRLSAVCVIIFAFAVIAAARQAGTPDAPEQAKAATPPATAPPSESRYVETTGFKTRIFEVKYGDAGRFVSLLAALTSGFKGAEVRYQPEFGTITARDFPENLAAMEEALKRLDKPQPPRPSLELHIHILIASDSAAAGSQEYPQELAEVVKQLQGTLRYKAYSLVASGIQRAREGGSGVNSSGAIGIGVDSSGVAVWGNPNAPGVRPANAHYEYSIRPISIDASADGRRSIEINDFRFQMGWPGSQVGFSNPLTLRDGEKVVVGTTTIGNGAVVVVLSGRIQN